MSLIGLLVKFLGDHLNKRESIAWGDVYLLSLSGFWIPLQDCPLFLFVVGTTGALLGWFWRYSVLPLGGIVVVCLGCYIFS